MNTHITHTHTNQSPTHLFDVFNYVFVCDQFACLPMLLYCVSPCIITISSFAWCVGRRTVRMQTGRGNHQTDLLLPERSFMPQQTAHNQNYRFSAKGLHLSSLSGILNVFTIVSM